MKGYVLIVPGKELKVENAVRLHSFSPMLVFDSASAAMSWLHYQPFSNIDYYQVLEVNVS